MKKTLWAATVLMQAATTPAKKPAQKSAAAKQPVPVKKGPASSRQQLKSATNQVAAGIRAAEVALTPAELEVASRVQTGQMPCELGATVNLEADGKMPGYFDLTGNGFKYRMHVVPTTTGAIRLEDQHEGAVWLQLANKSMLMSQKLGRRLADECLSPEGRQAPGRRMHHTDAGGSGRRAEEEPATQPDRRSAWCPQTLMDPLRRRRIRTSRHLPQKIYIAWRNPC